MWCNDPFLSLLKAFGYSVVRLPRPDLAPLRLLARLGADLEELGPVEAVLRPGPHVALPAVSRDRPCPALSGQRSASLDAGLGLSLLASLVTALGGAPQVARLVGRRARRVSFVFEGVREDSVALVDVDRYLGDARIDPEPRHLRRLLEADDLYLTTSVVKSRAFSITLSDESGGAIEVDLPAATAIVGATVQVSVAQASECGVRFEGREALGFGFRAVRLFYDNGRYTAFKPLAPGDLALERVAPASDWYGSEAAFVRLI